MSATPTPRELVQVSGGQIRLLVAPVARYTRLVLFGKHFLLLAIVAAVGGLVWMASGDGEEKGRLVFSGAQKVVPLINEMTELHYQGVDAKNQPYNLTAKKAVQKDAQTVHMESIRADMLEANGSWLAMDALSGEINTQTKNLTLMGGVALFYQGGYEFRTERAYIDINNSNAHGDVPIEGQGPAGTLKADSFLVVDRGSVIRFNGSVVTVLYPNRHD